MVNLPKISYLQYCKIFSSLVIGDILRLVLKYKVLFLECWDRTTPGPASETTEHV